MSNTTTNKLRALLQSNPGGLSASTIRRHLGGNGNLAYITKSLKAAGASQNEKGLWTVEAPQGLSLLERRKEAFRSAQRKFAASNHHTVNLGKEPYVLVHLGDPHLDDDGTDIEALEQDLNNIKNTPRMYAGCVGDTLNNWVGRLMAEYANQSSTLDEAWELAEWFFGAVQFLYVTQGNHDSWNQGSIAFKYLLKQKNQPAAGEDIQLVIEHGQDLEPIKFHIRHDFPGNSQWNPCHGHMKAAYDGDDADVLVSGHRHKTGMGQAVRRDGSTALCLQVGSYKVLDDYAIVSGFRPHQASPCVCTLVQPMLEGPDRVQVFWSTAEARRALLALI